MTSTPLSAERMAELRELLARFRAGLQIIQEAGAIHGGAWCAAQARGYLQDLDFDQYETGEARERSSRALHHPTAPLMSTAEPTPTLPDIAGAKEPQCQFGCKQAAGLYHLPRGCPCFETTEQWLCEPHLVKLRNNGYEAIPIFERPRSATLPDVAGAGEQAQSDKEAAQELVRIVMGNLTTLVEDESGRLYAAPAATKAIAKALTSAHLSGVREGREEAARVADKERSKWQRVVNGTSRREFSGQPKGTTTIGGACAASAVEAAQNIYVSIRALPDPPVGETT